MTTFDFAAALGAIQDANSVRALARLNAQLAKKHKGEAELSSLLKMIELKRQRLILEN